MTQKKGLSPANTVLALSGSIFFMTYPFTDIGVMEVVNHAAGAAFIGGLADWYAVTALFRHPLGIRFKTGLIPDNHQRMIELASDMVTKELLTKEALLLALRDKGLVKTVLSHFLSEKGKRELLLLGKLLVPVKEQLPLGQWSSLMKENLYEAIRQWKVTPFMVELLRYYLTSGHTKDLSLFIQQALQSMVKSDVFYSSLIALFGDVRKRYEDSHMFRELINEIVIHPNLVEAEARKIQKRIYYSLGEPASRDRITDFLEEKLSVMVNRLERDEAWQKKLEHGKNSLGQLLVTKNWDLDMFLVEGEKGEGFLQEKVHTFVENELKSLLAEEARITQLEAWVVEKIDSYWPYFEAHLAKEVQQKVREYSPQEISDLVEDKLGEDLQFVRINGSLVGGALGGLFGFISFLMKGVL